MMAQEAMTEAAAPARSFADSELPPLTSPAPDQFASPPAPAPSIPEAPPVPGATLFTAPAPVEKKKFELPQIESKLLIHGLLGGLAIILLVVALIAFYVHVHTSDDEGTPLPAAATKPAEAPSEAPAVAPVPEPAFSQAEDATALQAEEPIAVSEPVAKSRGRKAREAAPKPALAVAPGMLTVDSSPQGAQIQVDGHADSTWITPFTLSQLAPGQHNLTISKAGYTAETKVLTVSSGSRNALSVHLIPLAATISVSSDPLGASVWIDGRDSGKLTPATLTLEKGSHSVLVRKSGYLDETMTADVQPAQNIGFAPRLRPLGSTDEIRSVNKLKKMFGGKDGVAGMGSVAIRTTPKGAQISVNQRVLDRLSPAEFLLNPGNYVVDISATGYKPLRRVINVEKNSKLTIDEILERE